MTVVGEEARKWSAIRLDSLQSVEGARGKLLSADEGTGVVQWEDRAGETRRATLGLGAIRLVKKAR